MTNSLKLSKILLTALQILVDAFLYVSSFLFVAWLWYSGSKSGTGKIEFEVMAFFTGTMLAVFYFNSLYDFRSWLFWDEMKAILKSSALILLVVVLYLYTQHLDTSRFTLAAALLIFTPLCLIARYIFRRGFFAAGILVTNILIIGAGRTGEIFAQEIAEHPFTTCKVVGFLDDDDKKLNTQVAGYKVLGKLNDFEKIYNEIKIDEAAIAISTASRELLTHILDMVEFHVRQVHYIPDMYMLTTFSAQIRDVDGMPVISASQGLLNPFNRFIKSIMDYVGAVIGIIVFSPLMLWVAYKIHKEDGGPVMFIQKRIGWQTKYFMTYKFRSMHVNADEETKKLFQDPEIKKAYEEGIKLKDDPRWTKIGAFIRRTSIDELPQLFNVLKGEMSLVGPRPLPKSDFDLLYDEYLGKKIYTVKPGLTGFWQVSGRSDVDRETRRMMNLYYIRNWSVWLDIVILMRTVQAVITGKGAY